MKTSAFFIIFHYEKAFRYENINYQTKNKAHFPIY